MLLLPSTSIIMERMTPPTSSPDPLGGTPRTSTPVSTRKRRSPSKGISDYPQRQSLPALNDLHHGSQEIDPGQSQDATEDSRASPSFDGVGFSSSIVDHRSSQQSPEWTIASLNNARSASPAKKDTTKDSPGFTLSSPQEVFPALSSPSNSLENVRGGPSTTRIDARATLFPSTTKQKLSKDPSDHSHLLIRPPDRPRTSRIQDVNPVKSARKLFLPTTTKQTPLPSLSSPPGQHNHSGLPPTRTQSYTENAHTDQQEEDSIEMLRNLGPIRHRDDSHSRASLFKLPGSDTLFGCESDAIEEVGPDVMGFMEDAGGFDGLMGSTGLTKRVREGGSISISRDDHNGEHVFEDHDRVQVTDNVMSRVCGMSQSMVKNFLLYLLRFFPILPARICRIFYHKQHLRFLVSSNLNQPILASLLSNQTNKTGASIIVLYPRRDSSREDHPSFTDRQEGGA